MRKSYSKRKACTLNIPVVNTAHFSLDYLSRRKKETASFEEASQGRRGYETESESILKVVEGHST